MLIFFCYREKVWIFAFKFHCASILFYSLPLAFKKDSDAFIHSIFKPKSCVQWIKSLWEAVRFGERWEHSEKKIAAHLIRSRECNPSLGNTVAIVSVFVSISKVFSSLVIMPLLNLTFILVGQVTNVRFLPIKRKSNLWLSVYKWIPFLFLSIFQSLKMISFYVLFVKCLLWFGHLVFHSVKRHIQAHKVRWATTIFTNHQLHTIIEHQQHRNNNSGINVISFWFYVRAIS